jgi:hypothetical protein
LKNFFLFSKLLLYFKVQTLYSSLDLTETFSRNFHFYIVLKKNIMNKVIDPRLNVTAPLAVHPAVERHPPTFAVLLLLFWTFRPNLDVQAQGLKAGA